MAGLATKTEIAKSLSCRVRLEVLPTQAGFPVCFKADGGRFEVSANTLKLCSGAPYNFRLSFDPKLTIKSVELLVSDDAEPVTLPAAAPATPQPALHVQAVMPASQQNVVGDSKPVVSHEAPSPSPSLCPGPPLQAAESDVADLLGLGDDFMPAPASGGARSAPPATVAAMAEGPTCTGQAEAVEEGMSTQPLQTHDAVAAPATGAEDASVAGPSPVLEHTVTWGCTVPPSKKGVREMMHLHVSTQELGVIRLHLQVKVYKADDKACLNGEKLRFVQFNTLPDSVLDGYRAATVSFFSAP